MKGYCVFWIPSIYHVAPVPLSENSFLEKEDISDYHEHKNHTDDCDSILDAYVCTEESDSLISSPDNKPLIFYLRQYEKRFRDFTEQLEFDASYLMSILDSPDYRDVLYKEKFESFDARCIDILGEVVYYRALLYS